ncbi:MAG TPA: MurR/RpiR family transcriptional regulator [Actinopolymorphaceae bacterium]
MNERLLAAAPPTEAMLDLFQRVRLTPTQRRIAHSLLRHADSAAYLSAAEVAALAQVSQPSVSRFAMALGFDGYPALRRWLRELAPTGGTRSTTVGNEIQGALRAEAENLHGLADQLANLDRITAAGSLLAASRPLLVLGLRAAAPLAAYFTYFAAKVLPDVRALDTGGSLLYDRLDQARAAGATAMLAIVLPRYPRESIDAVREAQQIGLSVVVISDSPISPVAEHADVVLHAPVGTQLVFDLHTAPMALSMAVLQAICDANPADTQRRLEEFEESAAQRQVFAG